jgi:dTDP-4-amino-4,6-dideoxygalactose transaminase
LKDREIFCANPREQYLNSQSEINESVLRVLNSENYILGSEVKNFETEFAEYIGTKYCVGVNSGTDAIILSLKALGIGTGDEVLTPSHTALATISAIIAVGAEPIFVDICENNFTIDIEKAHSLLSLKSKALIVVHIYGHPCDMDLITNFIKTTGLKLLEDCAQAHGAEYKGRKVGTFGEISCFSFYPTKNLGAIGDGGAILTNDFDLFREVERSRQYGWDSEREIERFGTVSRLDEIQAAVLRTKLKYLDESNHKRNLIAKTYFEELGDLNIILPKPDKNVFHVFHLFVVRINGRDNLIDNLREVGIHLGIHYKIPGHEYYAKVTGKYFSDTQLAVTDKVSKEIVSLPMYPELQISDVKFVCRKIKERIA